MKHLTVAKTTLKSTSKNPYLHDKSSSCRDEGRDEFCVISEILFPLIFIVNSR